jgi:hypothetical protein
MAHNFGEVEYATFAVLETAKETTVLNAFLLAHPFIVPAIISAGGIILIWYVAWTFWNIFHDDGNNFDDEVPTTCGTGQLQDKSLPTGNCLPALPRNPELPVCPKQEHRIEKGNCAKGINELTIKTTPCGYQGQTLPGLVSSNSPSNESEDIPENKIEGRQANIPSQSDKKELFNQQPPKIENEHEVSDDMVIPDTSENSVGYVEDNDTPSDCINKEQITESDTKFNPLAKIKYTNKVLKQMLSGDYHSFPLSVDSFGSEGQVSEIVGGDGLTRTKVAIDGGFMNKNGIFEYIIESDGVTCNHRLFKPKLME